MAALRYFARNIFSNNLKPVNCIRSLNYSAVEYNENPNPSHLFFDRDVQSLLRTLTRVDLAKVFRKRRLGGKKLEDPEYKFMTEEQLQEAIEEAKNKAEELLQIPPVVPVRKPLNKVLSKDPALQGLETSRMIFTDITFGVKDSDRLIVVREPDGTLQEADWELRNRINQVYFPQKGRNIRLPKMFEESYLESLLNRREYVFILDNACLQFEPDDPVYQRVVSVTYQHANDHNGFELLRSTRHFGALVFYLVWNKSIDNLLLELLESCHIEEINALLEVYSKVHGVSFESDGELKAINDFITKCAVKKSVLELALQSYKELAKQREELERGIKQAHGFN